jgi:hypothetical protein
VFVSVSLCFFHCVLACPIKFVSECSCVATCLDICIYRGGSVYVSVLVCVYVDVRLVWLLCFAHVFLCVKLFVRPFVFVCICETEFISLCACVYVFYSVLHRPRTDQEVGNRNEMSGRPGQVTQLIRSYLGRNFCHPAARYIGSE